MHGLRVCTHMQLYMRAHVYIHTYIYIHGRRAHGLERWVRAALQHPHRSRPALHVCCSALQCVAVRCSVLHLARSGHPVHCSLLQCAAVCCSVLQCVAICCRLLQCVAVCCSVSSCILRAPGTQLQVMPCVCDMTHSYTWDMNHSHV